MLYFHFLLFLITFFLSLILTPLLMEASKKGKFLDVSDGDNLKIHKTPISYLGGLAIFLSVIIGLISLFFYQQSFKWKITGFILGAVIIFLLGFWDDLKWKHISKIQPYKKFVFLIACSLLSAIALITTGIRINFLSNVFLTVILSAGYIFVFINSINYQDGIDGLAGGTTIISIIGFIVLSIFMGNIFPLFFSIILLGSILGFLIFNFPPAKIFIGDSGAYFLGFSLVVLVSLSSKYYNILSLVGPIFIVGIPVFDGVFTNIRRIFSKKSIFLGDRSHFYDKLLKRFSIRKTLLISYSLQILSVITGLIIYFHV